MFISIVCIALSAIAHSALAAEAFPTRPIRLIVPFEAGGGTDINARIFAEHWSARLGQNVIVENRTGAAGAVATNFVARSPADGYIVCWCTNSPITLLPLIDKSLSYNPSIDLRPVGMIYADDGTISVRADLGVNTLAEFVNLARSEPGMIKFGSGGIGTIVHLGGELFASKAGIQLLHVPYKGEQFGVADLLGGRIDMYPLSQIGARQLASQGRIKVLAVRGPARSSILPGVPTLAEAGIAGAESSVLVALFVPAKTPDAVVQTLYVSAESALSDPAVREQIRNAGGRLMLQDPVTTAATFKAETGKWRPVTEKANLMER